MLAKLRKPFEKFQTEWLSFDFFQKLGTVIPPQNIDIPDDLFEKKSNNEKAKQKIIITQFVPLRHVLKISFELPNMYKETIEYCQTLETHTVITNVMQEECWRAKKKIVWRSMRATNVSLSG